MKEDLVQDPPQAKFGGGPGTRAFRLYSSFEPTLKQLEKRNISEDPFALPFLNEGRCGGAKPTRRSPR